MRVQTTVYMTTQTNDTTFAFGPVILWAQAEMACGFFIASAPSLPRVIRHTPWLSHLFGLESESDEVPFNPDNAGLRTFGRVGAAARRQPRGGVDDEISFRTDDNISFKHLGDSAMSKHSRFVDGTTSVVNTATDRISLAVPHETCDEIYLTIPKATMARRHGMIGSQFVWESK